MSEKENDKKRPSPVDLIDLCASDDDEASPSHLDDVRKRLKSCGDDDDDDDMPIVVKVEGAKVKSEKRSAAGPVADDGEVMLVEAPSMVPTEVSDGASDDDIAVVGTRNYVNLPHARCDCTVKPFVKTGLAHVKTATNQQTCDSCYCYVCDVKAEQCESWEIHCNAVTTGDRAAYWKMQRAARKRNDGSAPRLTPLRLAGTRFPFASLVGLTDSGPFRPNSAVAQNNQSLTKCRHCGWYTKFSHRNFAFHRALEEGRSTETREARWYRYRSVSEINPTGPEDWCHACGRVASERDFGKAQSKPFQDPTHKFVLLGTRAIPFRLHVHDPRKMTEFQTRWNENNWTFDEKAAAQELFQHRFGQRPTLEFILESIPVHSEDKIPVDGCTRRGIGDSQCAASETEALLLDDEKDRRLLSSLFTLNTGFGKHEYACEVVDGDIHATWDSEARSGTITIRVFANPESKKHDALHMTQFLASWYNVPLFTLTELVGRIKADYDADVFENMRGYNGGYRVDFLPHEVSSTDAPDVEQPIETLRNLLVDSFNDAVDAQEEKLSLQSGTGSSILGGVCTNESTFAGVLKRFCGDILPDVVKAYRNRNNACRSLAAHQLGASSTHRKVRTNSRYIVMDHCHDSSEISVGIQREFTSYLSEQDFACATLDHYSSVNDLMDRTKSLDGLMNHLENLGHTPAPHVDGLTVELLPFQKQSLQWALERETTPGGVQAFFWPKLPSVEEKDTEVYYNPVTGKCSTSKPRLVRGGIIAEQMGLGKTVISLSLILCNPAPATPESGSKSSEIPSNPDMSNGKAFWDPDLAQQISPETSAKRASILSRGTLVVCNVSLVGQWIEEARSKLENPGLVYAYHGGSRKRDPTILAEKSIVVTTYETLASDATYHKTKSKDSDYCPPCEQVRWWRIICDESHVLRNNNNGKCSAVMALFADHKWLVSGTPVNTTLMDLKNQLSFLGINGVSEMFSSFQKNVFKHVQDPKASSGVSRRRRSTRSCYYTETAPWIGHFCFLMRSVMIRHTQNQKYRATETTLMSLPPKAERIVLVPFSDEDKASYDVLESEALSFYKDFKATHRTELSKHYLKLITKLLPLRTACAGGRIPLLDADGNEDHHDENGDDAEDEEEAPRKRKKVQKYTEYAYTSKLKKLVSELEHIRDSDPTSKSLVFSQFTSTLKWLQEELPKHGFQFRTLSGDMTMKKRAKALSDFQNDPPTTIFLLSMRAGAVGINLTQANRVFIMEPCFNPALEKQAIGRVHRLGQKRNVEITHLIVEGSVEQRILKMLKKKYGDGKLKDASTDNKDEDIFEIDVKPTAVRVGSLITDKVKVLTEEFDLLYGYTGDDGVKDEVTLPDFDMFLADL